ncbi:MAG: hypothetical protein ACM3JJ_12220 [Hyphomicrobiales bacterium]
MKRAVLWLGLFALVAAPPAARSAEWKTPKGKTWTWTFAADTLGKAPDHARVEGGRWIVLFDSTRAPAGAIRAAGDTTAADSAALASWPRILRQADDQDGIVFHTIQFTRPLVGDLEASVRFRIRSGEIDPSAGLAFQLDPKGRNGYVVRVSGKSGELIAHYLIYGKRRDVKYDAIETPEPGTWHTLAIRRVGSVLTVSYDGKERFQLRDERYREGNVGLWTEDDTIVDFADLTVRSL